MRGFAYPTTFFVRLSEQELPAFDALSQLLAVPLPYVQRRASPEVNPMVVTLWLEEPPEVCRTGSEGPQTQVRKAPRHLPRHARASLGWYVFLAIEIFWSWRDCHCERWNEVGFALGATVVLLA